MDLSLGVASQNCCCGCCDGDTCCDLPVLEGASVLQWSACDSYLAVDSEGITITGPAVDGQPMQFIGASADPTIVADGMQGGTLLVPGVFTDPLYREAAGSLACPCQEFPVSLDVIGYPSQLTGDIAFSVLFEWLTAPTGGALMQLTSGFGAGETAVVFVDSSMGIKVQDDTGTFPPPAPSYFGPFGLDRPHLLTFSQAEGTSESIIELDGVAVAGPGAIWGGVNPDILVRHLLFGDGLWLRYWSAVYDATPANYAAVNAWATTKGALVTTDVPAVIDTFAGVGGTTLPLHVPDLGGPWTDVLPGMVLSGAGTAEIAGPYPAVAYASVTVSVDGYSQVTVADQEAAQQAALVVRFTDFDNGIVISRQVGGWEIIELAATVTVHTSVGHPVADGDVLRFEYHGLAMRVLLNGVVIDAWQLDAANLSATTTLVGAQTSATASPTFDDFEAGTISWA